MRKMISTALLRILLFISVTLLTAVSGNKYDNQQSFIYKFEHCVAFVVWSLC